MNTGIAVAGALGSALCFATSSVLQQHGAARAPRGSGLHLDLLAHLVRRPVWIAGIVAALGTLALQALALSAGQLTVVQPLLVAGLLFALPLSVVVEGRRPSLHEWGWALVLVVGLVTFLSGARPRSGPRLPDDDRLWQLGVVVLAIAITTAVLGSALGGRYRALLLGTAAGLTFGIAAALLKYCCALAGREGLGWLFSSWPAYALVVVGATGLLLTQAAFQAGPLCGALPVIAIIDPLTAVLFGVATYGERLATGPLSLLGQLVGFALMALAVVRLARLTAGRHAVGPRCTRPAAAAIPPVGVRVPVDAATPLPRASCESVEAGCPRQESNLWPTA